MPIQNYANPIDNIPEERKEHYTEGNAVDARMENILPGNKPGTEPGRGGIPEPRVSGLSNPRV